MRDKKDSKAAAQYDQQLEREKALTAKPAETLTPSLSSSSLDTTQQPKVVLKKKAVKQSVTLDE